MKYSFFITLLLCSCSHGPSIKVIETNSNKTMVSLDSAVQLSKTGFVRSCIQAHKYHDPKQSWGGLCQKEAEQYIEEIMSFLKN